jgi:hypothetical protein
MALTLVAFKLSITDMVPVRTRGVNHPPLHPIAATLCAFHLSAAPGQSAVSALASEAAKRMHPHVASSLLANASLPATPNSVALRFIRSFYP